jgi:hypothetical protein
MFKLEIEVIAPILRTVTKKFNSLKVMRQWQKRNDLRGCLWCLGYKEFILKNEQWEPFTVFGKQIVTLPELYKTIEKLIKSEDLNSSNLN